MSSDDIGSEPSFSVICSFFNKFGVMLGLPPLSFVKLEHLLTSNTEGRVDAELIDLHVKLLRKVGFVGTQTHKWMVVLSKFCSLDPNLEKEYLQLDRFGYAHSSLCTKLIVLKSLCEKQFDYNLKFKEAIMSSLNASDLRLLPVGIDKSGQAYWYQQDSDLNVRIYSEEPDDNSGGTWTLRVKCRDELNNLINKLNGVSVCATEPQCSKTANCNKESDAEQLPDTQPPPVAIEEESQNQAEATKTSTERAEPSAGDNEVAKVTGQPETTTTHPETTTTQPETTTTQPETTTTHPETTTTQPETTTTQPETTTQPTIENNNVDDSKAAHSKQEPDAEALKAAKVESDQISDDKIKVEPEKTEPIEDNSDSKDAADSDSRTSKLKVTNKRGTFMDIHQETKPLKKAQKGGRKTEIIEDAKSVVEDKSDDSMHEIPEHLKPFIDRRVLPRRSCRSVAPPISPKKEPLKSATSSPKTSAKSSPAKKSKPAAAVVESSEDSEAERDGMEEEEGSSQSDVEDEAEDNSSTDDDDEFVPLATLRAKAAKHGKPRKKRVRPIHPEEQMDSDFDADDQSVPALPKQRKQATQQTLCQHCTKSTQPDILLLCDECDDAWHTTCLRPALWYVPDGDWFCPKCQHKMLVEKLSSALEALDEALLKREHDNKMKRTVADRMQREMDFIGISLNNIIATDDNNENEEEQEDEMETSEEEQNSEENEGSGGERRSARNRTKYKKEKKKRRRSPEGAVIPIALARSRRQCQQVDYRFNQYDELIQESIEQIEEAPSRPKFTGVHRPAGGAGKGKDMANILAHAAKRAKSNSQDKSAEDDDSAHSGDEGAEAAGERVAGTAPLSNDHEHNVKVHMKKKHKKLTDLDVDNQTESDTDDYQASSGSGSMATPSEQSEEEDEWSGESACNRRQSNRVAARQRRADRRFIDDAGSDSDYIPSASTRRATKRARRKKRDYDDSEESATESEQSDDSLIAKSKKKPKRAAASDESTGSEYSPRKKAAGRRPTRKRVPLKKVVVEDEESDFDEEEEAEEGKGKKTPVVRKVTNERPRGAVQRLARAVIEDDSDENEKSSDGEKKTQDNEWRPGRDSEDDSVEEKKQGSDSEDNKHVSDSEKAKAMAAYDPASHTIPDESDEAESMDGDYAPNNTDTNKTTDHPLASIASPLPVQQVTMDTTDMQPLTAVQVVDSPKLVVSEHSALPDTQPPESSLQPLQSVPVQQQDMSDSQSRTRLEDTVSSVIGNMTDVSHTVSAVTDAQQLSTAPVTAKGKKKVTPRKERKKSTDAAQSSAASQNGKSNGAPSHNVMSLLQSRLSAPAPVPAVSVSTQPLIRHNMVPTRLNTPNATTVIRQAPSTVSNGNGNAPVQHMAHPVTMANGSPGLMPMMRMSVPGPGGQMIAMGYAPAPPNMYAPAHAHWQPYAMPPAGVVMPIVTGVQQYNPGAPNPYGPPMAAPQYANMQPVPVPTQQGLAPSSDSLSDVLSGAMQDSGY